MISGTCSRKDGSVRTTLLPVSLTSLSTSWWRGRVSPFLFARARSFSIAFPGIWMSFGQTFQQAWHDVQVKRPAFTASVTRSLESRGSSASLKSSLIAVGPANEITLRAGHAETHARHSMQLRSGLIASTVSGPGMTKSSPGTRAGITARYGSRSTIRSFCTGSSRGSMVIPSLASSMHARTGSPFTLTAQLPHWPDPQQ